MKFFKTLTLSLLMAATVAGLSSCEKNQSTTDGSNVDAHQKDILTNYVNNVVISTYSKLADEALILDKNCKDLNSKGANATQEQINAACDAWKKSRIYWEQSEAFLFGAAGDYSIDPHIDSWPLDKTALDNLLADEKIMADLNADYAGEMLGYGLLGFHAVEYIIFREGEPRDVKNITVNELKYLTAVAEDLCRQCILLECCWAGIDNISKDKQQIMTDTELAKPLVYGEAMITAGTSGNILYKTQKAAFEEIINAAMVIADEVGNTKITDPLESGNVLDVESWYSFNSIKDFTDNMISVQNAYNFGGDKSVSNHIASKDAALDKAITKAIEDAITAIKAMPAPFRDNLDKNNPQNKAAIAACNVVMNKLAEAIEVL